MPTENKPKVETYTGPVWFIFSYDAGERLYKTINESATVKRLVESRKYGNDDFRKRIIRTLRNRKAARVEKMDELVETTIVFKDIDNKLNLQKKMEYWMKEFTGLGADFNFVIAPLIRIKDKDAALIDGKPKSVLNQNFQKLLKEVKAEEADTTPQQSQ